MTFDDFWRLGFKRLVPIIPPAADISPRSTLHKRIGTKQDGRGKTPGTKGRDGLWSSFDWSHYESTEDDLPRWAAMGAGVGIKTGIADNTCGPDSVVSLIAIDADTLNQDYAVIIRDEITARFGRLPVRVGQAPKALYLLIVDGKVPYSRIEFGDERVEVLTEGRQFVAEGVHPKTGKPYTWPRGVPNIADIPNVDPEQVTALLEALRTKLPAASKVITEGAGADVGQEGLKGDLDLVRKAVRATPNTSASFPSRESYLQYGYAIKAALPDDEPAAFDLFSDWCSRWDDGENEPDVIAADWRRMKPPFRRGAPWLYELAGAEAIWFEPIPEIGLNPFDIQPTEPRDDVYPLLRIGEIIDRPPPVFLVDRHIPEVSLGFLYSDPGAGKSFLALDVGLSLAYALDKWHGDGIHAPDDTAVVYIAAEGSYGFRNRIRAWMRARGFTDQAKRFLMIEKTINFMKPEDVEKLLRTVRSIDGLRACLIVVDTVSRALPGSDENLQKEMSLFVEACDKLKSAFRCSVLGIHHAGKSGDMRGSTVLRGAGDYVFKLERKRGATIGNLTCEKQKDAPDGWTEPYRFDVVQLDDGESSLVPARADLSVGPSVELTPSTSRMVLEAMRRAWESGEPWSKSHVAKERYAVRRMIADFGFTADKAESLLMTWEQTGLIVHDTLSGKAKLKGFKVQADMDNLSGDEPVSGVFD